MPHAALPLSGCSCFMSHEVVKTKDSAKEIKYLQTDSDRQGVRKIDGERARERERVAGMLLA